MVLLACHYTTTCAGVGKTVAGEGRTDLGHPYQLNQSTVSAFKVQPDFNPLNTELNPICHLLALLGAHHILHISRIRVKIRNLK